MSYYFIANINISDPDEYKKYLVETDVVFSKYNGKYLAVDKSPIKLEGNWNYGRCVIIYFESKEDFENWYHSDEYQEILQYRLAAATCDTILVEGLK